MKCAPNGFHTMHVHELLKQRGQTQKPTQLVQIGAMDGVTADPVHEALIAYDWHALIVEPIERHFKTLQRVYKDRPDIQLEQTAIADHSGVTKFYTLPADNNDLPGWADGASSLYKDRTALVWEDIASYVVEITVPCLTLPDLLAKYKVDSIDILQIDAEGADFMILQQLAA